MTQNINDLVQMERREELQEFAKYLGVDLEDYLEHLHPDVDFDDYSK